MKQWDRILNNHHYTWHGAKSHWEPIDYISTVGLLEMHYIVQSRPSINNIGFTDNPDNGIYWTARKIKHLIDLVTGFHKLNRCEVLDLEWSEHILGEKILDLIHIDVRELDWVIYKLGLYSDFSVREYWEDFEGSMYWMPSTKKLMQLIRRRRKSMAMHGKRSRAKAAAAAR